MLKAFGSLPPTSGLGEEYWIFSQENTYTLGPHTGKILNSFQTMLVLNANL